MISVAVFASSDVVAGSILDELRQSPQVRTCARALTAEHGALATTDALVLAGGAEARLASAREILAAARRGRLSQLVLISSAEIYGASHQNVGRITESAFIPSRDSVVPRRWTAFEALAAEARPGTAVAVLRPAAVLDGEGHLSRLLGGRIGVTYPGHDPTLQCLSPRDLSRAVRLVIEQRATGCFNVAPAGAIPLKRALHVAGVTRLPIPRLAQSAARRLLGPIDLAFPAEQLDYIRYPWTVSGDRLEHEVGFVPARTSAAAIAELRGRTPRAEDEPHDPFGMDAAYIRRYCRHLFRFLHQAYWRVELCGLEHLPREGRGVLVGMHRGFMPFDGVMALYALVRHAGRIPRFLIHPSLTKFPFLGDFMAKLGGIMACTENGDWVLQRDELLGVFPEGIRGAFTPYRHAYTLGKFGRDEFVRMALRNRAPILPFVTVGSAEIYPILGRIDWRWFKRYTEWPYLPITPAPFPLPSKWHTAFLPPMHVEQSYGPDAADDPGVVKHVSHQVRRQMQEAIADMLPKRRSIFHGSIFTEPARP